MPLIAAVADARVGLCVVDVYPLGPVHEYVAPVDGVDPPVNVNVAPSHIGLLLVAVATGIAFTVTATVDAVLVQPFTVTVKLYVPLAAVVAAVIVGFCNVLVNPFGPLHE